MAGREKQKVYEYSKKGKYLKTHESMSEFATLYGYSKNIFAVGRYNGIIELDHGRIASLDRIGRVGVLEFQKRKASPYVGKGKNIAEGRLWSEGRDGEIEVYDLDGDKIATFKNLFVAKKMMKLHEGFHIDNARTIFPDGLLLKRVKKDEK